MNAPAASPLASACVSEERLWQLLMDMAAYGATAGGGVNRQALSVEDTAAKKHVVRWATERGFTTFQDDIGNLFVRRDGTEPTLAPVMTSSRRSRCRHDGKCTGFWPVRSHKGGYLYPLNKLYLLICVSVRILGVFTCVDRWM